MPLGEVALNAVVNGLVGLAVKTAGEAAPDRVRELSPTFLNLAIFFESLRRAIEDLRFQRSVK